jgi:ribose 5-phosphate isomerase B
LSRFFAIAKNQIAILSAMDKIFIACDHAGIEAKRAMIAFLKDYECEIYDLGCEGEDRVDYPDYAAKVGERVAADKEALGVLICATGIGMSIAANKIRGVRAALAHDAYTAEMARRHNDANILCLGARVIAAGEMESAIAVWLGAEFEGGRHANRVKKITKLEAEK